MTAGSGNLLLHRTIFDSWQSMTVAIGLALVGYSVPVGIPVISTAWVVKLGFTDVQVGRVAGADQASELLVLPMLSMNGIYLVFIGGYVFSLLFLGWVPRSIRSKRASTLRSILKMALASITRNTCMSRPTFHGWC